MATAARSVREAVTRVSCRDPNLELINLNGKWRTDYELAELVDCLLAHPDVVRRVYLGTNELTDETGVKLAQYLAASCTVRALILTNTRIGPATYLALAAALQFNSSLTSLYLHGNEAVDETRIDAAFIDALRLNPHRPTTSYWQLFSFGQNDYKRLKDDADERGHPSLQLLATRLLSDDRPTVAAALIRSTAAETLALT